MHRSRVSHQRVLVVGDIYGMASDTSLGIDTVQFGVTLSSGMSPFDFRGSQMIMSTDGPLESLAYSSGAVQPGWAVEYLRFWGTVITTVS